MPGHPASVAKPAGVGVSADVVYTEVPENRSVSNPPKRNALFLTIGPPIVPPLNSSLNRGGPVKGLGGMVPGFEVLRCVLVSASRNDDLSWPNTLPCQPLVPDFVRMFTTEPELRPYSGPKLLLTITYCPTNSVSDTNKPGPPTL